MLPDMSKTVLSFSQPITKRDNVQTIVDYEPVNTFINGTIKGVITTPKPEDLQNIEVNSSLKYKLLHTVDEITIDDRFIHKNIQYKVIAEQDRDDYGYYRVMGEEVQ